MSQPEIDATIIALRERLEQTWLAKPGVQPGAIADHLHRATEQQRADKLNVNRAEYVNAQGAKR